MKTFFSTLLLLLGFSQASALTITAVKSDRVLIDLQGDDSVNIGARLGARDSSNKLRALLEVKQIKNGKAVAVVLRGKMQVGYSLIKSSGSAGSKRSPKSKSSWALLAGYANNSMTVKPSGNASISLSGSSFSLSALYDTNVSGNWNARLLTGYETLQATGTAATATCNGSTNCVVDLSYLGLEALVKYSYLRSKSIDAWAGMGLGFLFAMGKSSNILDVSKITTNQTIVGSLGVDILMSRGQYIPLQFDYALFPDNSTSAASQMILRVGYGFSF